MAGNKIKYSCKNCGWSASIIEEWADIKPKRCMNKKCNTSFMKYPEALIVDLPNKIEEVKKVTRRSKKNEEKDSNS